MLQVESVGFGICHFAFLINWRLFIGIKMNYNFESMFKFQTIKT